jgi:hypothetical protein
MIYGAPAENLVDEAEAAEAEADRQFAADMDAIDAKHGEPPGSWRAQEAAWDAVRSTPAMDPAGLIPGRPTAPPATTAPQAAALALLGGH